LGQLVVLASAETARAMETAMVLNAGMKNAGFNAVAMERS
jgi:hypothetical protein